MTDLQRRIIAAMLPGVRHSVQDLAEASERAKSTVRWHLEKLVDAGMVRKYGFAYSLTPKGFVFRREITRGGGAQ